MAIESNAQAIENDYKIQGKLGEGTFSQVLKMRHRVSGKIVAMKRFKKRYKSIEDIECLREVQALKKLRAHPNIIQMEDIIFDSSTGTLYLAFELMDCNLYDMISKSTTVINESKVRLWFFQLCKGLEYLHGRGIFHRDIKPENILIHDNIIKIADLGSCRGIHSKGPFTEYIATRWYRPPEVLLTTGKYSSKMDIWGTGCVLYETITRQPLFPGSDTLDQLQRIHQKLGSPAESQLRMILGRHMEQERYTFPSYEGSGILLPSPFDQTCHSLLLDMLAYVPDERVTATQTLAHSFFKSIDLTVFPKATQLIYQSASTSSRTEPSSLSHPPNSSSILSSTTTKLPQLSNPSSSYRSPLIAPPLASTTSFYKKNRKDNFQPMLPTLLNAPLTHSFSSNSSHPRPSQTISPLLHVQSKKPIEFQWLLPEISKPMHPPGPYLAPLHEQQQRKLNHVKHNQEDRKMIRKGL